MCNPTYPIFRCAAVVSATGHVTPEQTVGIGARVSESSVDFVDRLKDFIQNHSTRLSNVELAPGEEKDQPRVRVEPAIIVDFPVLRFMWRKLILESRVSVTTWAGDRKAKLWIRINFVDAVRDNRAIQEFFIEMREEGAEIQKFCLAYFDSLLGRKYQPEKIYTIYIQMVSSPNYKLAQAISGYWDFVQEPDSAQLRDAVLDIFSSEFGIDLPREKGARRFVESYVFPLIDPRIMAERRGADPVDLRKTVIREIGSLDELKAGVVIDTYDDRADIWGVVYEQEPIGKHASGPLIVSGELGLVLGGVY